MKTIEDFKIINGVAVLEGVAYAEEVIVVEAYLKANKQIGNVSVKSKDGRSFELKNGKLVLSGGQTFTNPYLINEIKELNQKAVGDKMKSLIEAETKNKKTDYELEQRLVNLEERYNKLQSLILEITYLLKSYSE